MAPTPVLSISSYTNILIYYSVIGTMRLLIVYDQATKMVSTADGSLVVYAGSPEDDEFKYAHAR